MYFKIWFIYHSEIDLISIYVKCVFALYFCYFIISSYNIKLNFSWFLYMLQIFVFTYFIAYM